jgi:hypothetical protein
MRWQTAVLVSAVALLSILARKDAEFFRHTRHLEHDRNPF